VSLRDGREGDGCDIAGAVDTEKARRDPLSHIVQRAQLVHVGHLILREASQATFERGHGLPETLHVPNDEGLELRGRSMTEGGSGCVHLFAYPAQSVAVWVPRALAASRSGSARH
jgi:hypothetical protein